VLAFRATWKFLLFTTVSRYLWLVYAPRRVRVFPVSSRCCPAILHLGWGVSDVLEYTVSDCRP
jgi:hypothetical protein